MSENHDVDPAGSTQAFRAFVGEEQQRPVEAPTGSRTGLMIGVAVLVVAALAVLAYVLIA